MLKHVRVVPVHTGTFSTYIWGRVLSGHTAGGGVFIGKNKFANFRVTKICPRISLDPRGSPKETIGSYPFFVQSLNAPLLPVAMYSSYEARKNTLQTICSATFAPFTPHHTPLHHQRHHTTKKQRHTYTHM